MNTTELWPQIVSIVSQFVNWAVNDPESRGIELALLGLTLLSGTLALIAREVKGL